MEGDEKRGGGDCVREYGISVAEYRSEAYTPPHPEEKTREGKRRVCREDKGEGTEKRRETGG